MAQYIDKSALVAEIEKLISNGKFKCQQSQENNDHISYTAWSEHIATCGKILSFLNSLEVKEVDLKKEIDDTFLENKCNITDNVSLAEFARIAKHFFELGMAVSNKAQKKE